MYVTSVSKWKPSRRVLVIVVHAVQQYGAMTTTTSEFLTVPEVATRLRVDPATIRRWITAGTLPAIKIGRSYRVDQHQVEAVLHKYRTSQPLTIRPGGTS